MRLIPGRFSLTLSSKINRVVEDIVVSIHLGAGASSVSATATGDRPPMSLSGPTGAGKKDMAAEGFAGGGNWEFDPHSRVSHLLLSGASFTNASGLEVDNSILIA
jgi:AP-3 complex subunit mu